MDFHPQQCRVPQKQLAEKRGSIEGTWRHSGSGEYVQHTVKLYKCVVLHARSNGHTVLHRPKQITTANGWKESPPPCSQTYFKWTSRQEGCRPKLPMDSTRNLGNACATCLAQEGPLPNPVGSKSRSQCVC